MYATDRFEDSTLRRPVVSGVTHQQVLRWLAEAAGVARRRCSFSEDPYGAETIDSPSCSARAAKDPGLVISVALGLIVGAIVAALLIATA